MKIRQYLIMTWLLALFPAIASASVMEYNWAYTADSYHILIATNDSFFAPVVDDVVWGTNYVADLSAGRYFLKIAPVSMGIDGRFSEVSRFEVDEKMENNKIVPRATIYFGTENISQKSGQTNSRWHWVLKTNAPLNSDSKILYGIDDFVKPRESRSQNIDIDLTYLPEGRHHIYYRLVNPLGVAGKIESREFIVDRTPPELEIRYDRSLKTGEKVILLPGSRISVQAVDKQGECSLFFSINGKAVRGQTATVPAGKDLLKILVFSRDPSENERYIIQNCLIDSKGPVINLFQSQTKLAPTNQILQNSVLRIDMQDIAGVSESIVELDGLRQKISAISISTLSEGAHSLRIMAADGLNNTSEAAWSIIIKNHDNRQNMVYRLK